MTPADAYFRVNDINRTYGVVERHPEIEAIIAQSAYASFNYAKHVLEGRFPLGEAVIATDVHYAYAYALEVIHGRFPLGEAVIATDAQYAYCYACYVIGGRWREAEAVIRNSGYFESYIGNFFMKSLVKTKVNWVKEGF